MLHMLHILAKLHYYNIILCHKKRELVDRPLPCLPSPKAYSTPAGRGELRPIQKARGLSSLSQSVLTLGCVREQGTRPIEATVSSTVTMYACLKGDDIPPLNVHHEQAQSLEQAFFLKCTKGHVEMPKPHTIAAKNILELLR